MEDPKDAPVQNQDSSEPTPAEAPTPAPAVEAPVAQIETIVEPKKGRLHFFRPSKLLPGPLRTKLGRYATPVATLIILILLSGVGFAAWHFTRPAKTPVERFQVAPVKFSVVSTTPAKDSTDVSPSDPIVIDFNEPIDPQSLQGNLFTTPMVNGKFSQGKTASEAVFTPDTPFAQGTKVQVMLNGTFQSAHGDKLGANFYYGYTTSVGQNQVVFQAQDGLYSIVDTATANKKQTYQLTFGDAVASSVSVSVYKSSMSDLLNSLVTTTKTSDGYSFQDYASDVVGTAGLTQVSGPKSLKNNGSFDVTQDTGVYLAVARDSHGAQLGHLWIVYSNFGVLLRQDDQKMVLNSQNLNDSSDVTSSVKFYSLTDSVSLLGQVDVNGLASMNLPYSPKVDVAIATASDGSQAFVPVSAINSLADVRNERDLAKTDTIYGLTDKPTYQAGDKVQFAGFVRKDNDAQYSVVSGGSLNLYVAYGPYGDHLADFSAPVDSSGNFSGSLTTNKSWLTNGDTAAQPHIYADEGTGSAGDNIDVAGFTVTTRAQSSNVVSVQFSKGSYLPTDSVTATVTATSASGAALANATVNIHTYSKDYFENDPSGNLNSFSDTGSEIDGSPTTLKLDSHGQGTVTVNVAKLPNDGSQLVTIQAGYASAGATASGGASAVVHQGNGSLEFGVSRSVVLSGGTLISRIYAKQLNNSPLANASISYSLSQQTYDATGTHQTQIKSGTAKTNSSGFAQLSIGLPSSLKPGDSLELDASTGDAQNNKIKATNYYYVGDSSGLGDESGAELQDLDISGSSGQVNLGDKVSLTINSPQALHTMVTMDRGRIYNAQMLDLKSGDNSFSFTVTPNLAPSFTLTFGYFENGVYHSEGVQFNVDMSSKQASLQLTPSAQTLSAGANETVQITTKSANGSALTSNVIMGVVDANAYKLYDQVLPDMLNFMYMPRVLTTSSSSSLTGIGSGGGKCGGGWAQQPDFTNAVGSVLLWKPNLTTNGSGTASISFKPPKGTWRVYAYSMSGNSEVASAVTTITSK